MALRFFPMFVIAVLGFAGSASAEFNIVKYYLDGGPIMHPLLLFSVIVVGISIERLLVSFMLSRRLTAKAFTNFMEKTLNENPNNKEAAVDAMIEFCNKKGGPVASVLLEGLNKYKDSKKNGLDMMNTKAWMNSAIEERGRVEIPVLEARLGVIATIANISPLVGLFGTVVGMIGAFETMAQSAGGAKPDELSGNISVALLTTAGGLFVAIPALLVYSYLKTKTETYILQMEEVAIVMVDALVSN